jgi:hypothetical protein
MAMRSTKRLLIALIVFSSSLQSHAWVTGRVIDGAGAAVPDAMVTYENLANRLIYVYTNGKGTFAIPSPQEWDLKNLPMYLDPTPVIQRQIKENSVASDGLRIRMHGTRVMFSLSVPSTVHAQLFDLTGGRIARLFGTALAAGEYAFDAFGGVEGVLSKQLYVVSVSDGVHTHSLTVMNLGNNRSAHGSFPIDAQVPSYLQKEFRQLPTRFGLAKPGTPRQKRVSRATMKPRAL